MPLLNRCNLVWILLVMLLGSFTSADGQHAEYHLLKKIPLGGVGAGAKREYFDYITVDAETRRVYLSHGTEVKVIDADTNAVLGNIGGLRLAHGLCY